MIKTIKIILIDIANRLLRKNAPNNLHSIYQYTHPTNSDQWVYAWAEYLETIEKETTIKTVDQIFQQAGKRITIKQHLFVYEYSDEIYDAILLEDYSSTPQPVKARKHDGKRYAQIKINPSRPNQYEFVYCDKNHD